MHSNAKFPLKMSAAKAPWIGIFYARALSSSLLRNLSEGFAIGTQQKYGTEIENLLTGSVSGERLMAPESGSAPGSGQSTWSRTQILLNLSTDLLTEPYQRGLIVRIQIIHTWSGRSFREAAAARRFL